MRRSDSTKPRPHSGRDFSTKRYAARQFYQFLSLCPRGNRWTVSRWLARGLTDSEDWQCLRYVYEDTETL